MERKKTHQFFLDCMQAKASSKPVYRGSIEVQLQLYKDIIKYDAKHHQNDTCFLKLTITILLLYCTVHART